MFGTVFLRVLEMFIFALPGFVFVKIKKIPQENISSFARVLAYWYGPCISFYAFSQAHYTPELNRTFLICLFVGIALCFSMVLLVYACLGNRGRENVKWRVFSVAASLGNVGFFGIPLFQKIFPDRSDLLILSDALSVALNLVAWTVGVFVITRDKNNVHPIKFLTVPHFIAFLLIYPMFVLQIQLPSFLSSAISTMGQMSTPLCMLILGMRLATVPMKRLATDYQALLASFAKLVVFPMVMWLVVRFLPIPEAAKQAMFVFACVPCASMILNLAEIKGEGQESAADTLLVSTILSLLTIPLMTSLFL